MDNNAMLHIDDVTVAFPHAGPAGSKEKRMHTVLNHLHLDVEASEFVCVVGPSGCGKTTLLNIIAGFQPYAGDLPRGCLFAPRCPHRTAQCESAVPPVRRVRDGEVRCFHAT